MKAERVALVTGAGGGIGRAVSLALLADGWNVVLAGRGVEALEQTAALAGERRPAAMIKSTDVADPQAVDALFETLRQRFVRLDLLFNNAGVNVGHRRDLHGILPRPTDETAEDLQFVSMGIEAVQGITPYKVS